MDRVHGAAPHFKGAVKLRRFVLDEEGAAERTAFNRGKDAAERGTSPVECPYRARDLADAWLRGWTFAANCVNGKRPLDTVRRKP